MNKQGWLHLLRHWDMERVMQNALNAGVKESDTFICIVAGRLDRNFRYAVGKALSVDKISPNGEGFKLPSDTDSPFARPWKRGKWSSPAYTANDRRRLWLLEQVEKAHD